MTWGRILTNWVFLEADFQSIYGLDLSSLELRKGKDWRWFAVRVKGLLATPQSRLARTFQPAPEQPSSEPEMDSALV